MKSTFENRRFKSYPPAILREARDALRQVRPCAIILTIALRGEESWHWLAELEGGRRDTRNSHHHCYRGGRSRQGFDRWAPMPIASSR